MSEIVLAGVECRADSNVDIGPIIPDDAGWTELAQVSATVPYSTQSFRHDQVTSFVFGVFSRSITPGILDSWDFHVSTSAGTDTPGASAPQVQLEGRLLRYGKVTGISDVTSVIDTWFGSYYSEGADAPDLTVPGVSGDVTVLIGASGAVLTNAIQPSGYPPEADAEHTLIEQTPVVFQFEGAMGDLTFTGTPDAYGNGIQAYVMVGLAGGEWTLCDLGVGQNYSGTGTRAITLATDNACPFPTALYGWGVLTGGGFGRRMVIHDKNENETTA